MVIVVGRSAGSVGLSVGRFVSRFAGWSVCQSVCRSVGLAVGLPVGLSARFLSNRECCRYQTRICGYVQWALGPQQESGAVSSKNSIFLAGA